MIVLYNVWFPFLSSGPSFPPVAAVTGSAEHGELNREVRRAEKAVYSAIRNNNIVAARNAWVTYDSLGFNHFNADLRLTLARFFVARGRPSEAKSILESLVSPPPEYRFDRPASREATILLRHCNEALTGTGLNQAYLA